MSEPSASNGNGILQPGAVAPDFSLQASPERMLSLHELRGAPVALVFYPADWSAVCGDELTIFNQALPLFERKHTRVLGISVDGVWCHQAFVQANNLRFDLLADFEPKGEVSRAYGAYDPAGYSKRALFLIDAQGRIAWSHLSPDEVNPGADGILDALDVLLGTST